MPGIESKAKELKVKFYKGAPKDNQPKIQEVIDIYKSGKNVNFRTVQNVVLGLYSPSLFGRKKAEQNYQDFLSAYNNAEELPKGLVRVRKERLRLEDQLDRLKGVKKKYQLDVILYTEESKRNRDAFQDNEPLPRVGKMKLDNRRFTKKHKGLSQYHKGTLDVEAPNDSVFKECKWRMIVRGSPEFRSLYPSA